MSGFRITTRDGCLFDGDRLINTIEADKLAREHGFLYAEHLVKHLERTKVTWVLDDICVCNDCGAYAATEARIKHHKTCKPGEAKRWENFYEKANEESDEIAY